MKPKTVIGWHKAGFRALWRRKSSGGKPGRPRIPREHIAWIRRMSRDHPEMGEDAIAEELAAKFGVHHSGSTVRVYMVRKSNGPRGAHTWRTFIRNHAKEVWACDFAVQHTALFAIVYVFVVMEIASRKIVCANVTTSPSLAWVKQVAHGHPGPATLVRPAHRRSARRHPGATDRASWYTTPRSQDGGGARRRRPKGRGQEAPATMGSSASSASR